MAWPSDWDHCSFVDAASANIPFHVVAPDQGRRDGCRNPPPVRRPGPASLDLGSSAPRLLIGLFARPRQRFWRDRLDPSCARRTLRLDHIRQEQAARRQQSSHSRLLPSFAQASELPHFRFPLVPFNNTRTENQQNWCSATCSNPPTDRALGLHNEEGRPTTRLHVWRGGLRKSRWAQPRNQPRG